MFTRMNIISSLLLSSILVLSFLTAGTSAADPSLPVFAYSGPDGPDHWGSLCPDYETCSSVGMQSPVDIDEDELDNTTWTPLNSDYKPSVNATLVNNCYHVGIHFEESAGVLNVEGKNYTLKKIHWHSPSEHTIDGHQYAAELHLVHVAADASISVVGILYDTDGDDDPDTFLQKIQANLAVLPNVTCGDHEVEIPLGSLDLSELRKPTKQYYRYGGSLTTPPCYENVIWTVLGEVRSISSEQVDALKAPLTSSYKNNSRPCQPLKQRKIELYESDEDDNDN